jgi:hypothetical protein
MGNNGLGFDIPDWAAEQFWTGVVVAGPHDCWHYRPDQPGLRSRRGRYGHVRIRFLGHDVIASRVAYVLGGGVIDNQVVMHDCDVADCMNPAHLRCGSIRQNNADRDARNRRTPYLPRGAQHWSAKLSEREVAAVRRARELGVSAQALAAMWGLSLATVYNVWSGRHYPTSTATRTTTGHRSVAS